MTYASGTSIYVYTLVDENGNLLLDENGNELTASVIVNVYGTVLYAKETNYTVHADNSNELGTGFVTNNYYLIDEDSDILIDEDGDLLISEDEEQVYGTVLYSKGTDYTVHTEV